MFWLEKSFVSFARAVFVILAVVVCGFVFYMTGCQDVGFTGIPTFNCAEEMGVEGVTCRTVDAGAGTENNIDEDGTVFGDSADRVRNSVSQGGGSRNIVEITTQLGRVDVLFVVDYSKSMEKELRSIGDQFTSFLDDIRQTDYQIAIITTDVAADRGQFLSFSNGRSFLSNPNKDKNVHQSNVGLFQEAITRPIQESAGDERGIYALNLALDNSLHSSFFRPHSLLLIIIVSDEDERSYGGRAPTGHFDMHQRVKPLELYDYPETFFQKVSHQHKFSIVAVHSIIVKPGDTRCERENGGIPGRIYQSASLPDDKIISRYGNINKGHVGSICSSNYSSQLGPIAYGLDQVPPVPLPCFPVANSVSLKINGEKINIRVEGRKMIVEDKIPFGSRAKIDFRCQPPKS